MLQTFSPCNELAARQFCCKKKIKNRLTKQDYFYVFGFTSLLPKFPRLPPFLARAWPAAGPRGALHRDGQTRQASNSERFLRMMMIRPIGCLFETHYEGGESEAEGPLGGHGVEPTCPLQGRQAKRLGATHKTKSVVCTVLP